MTKAEPVRDVCYECGHVVSARSTAAAAEASVAHIGYAHNVKTAAALLVKIPSWKGRQDGA